jgi:hypothetical protein
MIKRASIQMAASPDFRVAFYEITPPSGFASVALATDKFRYRPHSRARLSPRGAIQSPTAPSEPTRLVLGESPLVRPAQKLERQCYRGSATTITGRRAAQIGRFLRLRN